MIRYATTRRILPLAVLFGVAGLAGCKGKSAPPSANPAVSASAKPLATMATDIASCDVVGQLSLCHEFSAANIKAVGQDKLQILCRGLHGSYKAEACPKQGRVGACEMEAETKVYYREGPLALTADHAEKQCKDGIPPGTWKP